MSGMVLRATCAMALAGTPAAMSAQPLRRALFTQRDIAVGTMAVLLEECLFESVGVLGCAAFVLVRYVQAKRIEQYRQYIKNQYGFALETK